MEKTTTLSRRLWIYCSSISLEPHINGIRTTLEGFMNSWKNEKNPLVQGDFQILHNHFLLVFADETAASLSGCSIDSLQRQILKLGQGLGVDFLNRQVYFESQDGVIQNASRLEFRELAKKGEVNGESWVFDTALTQEKDYLEKGFRLQAKDSWHSRLLGL